MRFIVSTVPDVPELFRTQITNSCSTSIHESKSSSAIEYHRNDYFRTYMRKRRANENDECRETRLSKQRKYKQQRRSVQKKSTAEELAQSKNTHKKTPIKIVIVEKKGYPNNVNTQSNGKLNKEKLQQMDSHNPKTHNGSLLHKTNIHQTHFHNLKVYSNQYLQKRMIQKKDFMEINSMKGLLII